MGDAIPRLVVFWIFALQLVLAEPNYNKECAAIHRYEDEQVALRFVKVDGAVFFVMTILNFSDFVAAVGTNCLKPNSSNVIDWHLYSPKDVAARAALMSPIKRNHSSALIAAAHGSAWVLNTREDLVLSSACEERVAGRYDPGLACSEKSGNVLCNKLKIPPSSVLSLDGKYNCTPALYSKSSFACEAGDFSGKYGPLILPEPLQDEDNEDAVVMAFMMEDTYDALNSCELEGLIVALTCDSDLNSNKFLICMDLELIDGQGIWQTIQGVS